jgi:molybdenum cofactor synthesis domain-containing protein
MATVMPAIVVVVSTRAAAGTRPDTVGPDLVDRLREAGWDVVLTPVVLPDDEAQLSARLIALVDAGHRLIVTTGGTGLSPSDRTPEATIKIGERQVPGVAELMRSAGIASTPLAALSRGVAVVRKQALIVNLPGSPQGADQSLRAVIPILRHALDQLSGGDHHG